MAKHSPSSIVAGSPGRVQKGPKTARTWPLNRNEPQWWSQRGVEDLYTAIAAPASDPAYLAARVGLAYCAANFAVLAIALLALAVLR